MYWSKFNSLIWYKKKIVNTWQNSDNILFIVLWKVYLIQLHVNVVSVTASNILYMFLYKKNVWITRSLSVSLLLNIDYLFNKKTPIKIFNSSKFCSRKIRLLNILYIFIQWKNLMIFNNSIKSAKGALNK